MLRLRWVWVFIHGVITDKSGYVTAGKEICDYFGNFSLQNGLFESVVFLNAPSPQSPASPVLPLGLVHAAGLGGVSRLPPRIPAARHSQLEQVCQKGPRRLRPAGPPGPGGQPEV